MIVGPGETASGTIVTFGDLLSVLDGGRALDTKVFGIEDIHKGGTATGTIVEDRGQDEVSGSATGTIVRVGGRLQVFAGGTVTNTMIDGGIVDIKSGGTASGTTVSGVFEVHGDAVGTTVDGGLMGIYGTATNTTVLKADDVDVRGKAISTTIYTGAKVEVLDGGTAVDTVLNGGVLQADKGSTVDGVTFTNAGGSLQLDKSQSFHGLIAGFASPQGVAEEIDLRDIAFGPFTKETFTEASNNLSGTLTVANGSQTASLTLLGQYSTANFHLSSDTAGGTIITDPSPVGSATHPALATPV